MTLNHCVAVVSLDLEIQFLSILMICQIWALKTRVDSFVGAWWHMHN